MAEAASNSVCSSSTAAAASPPPAAPPAAIATGAAADPETSRPVYARLRELAASLRGEPGGEGLRELSMGMSDDFEVAIEEGATIVRVGTAIFGPR